MPVGFSSKKMFISKDAPAQHQQDASFYDASKFVYRFNETLESTPSRAPTRVPFDPNTSLPPK
jgi:hypothetical protein